MIKNYKLISFLIFIGQRIFFVRGSLKRFLNAYIHKLVNYDSSKDILDSRVGAVVGGVPFFFYFDGMSETKQIFGSYNKKEIDFLKQNTHADSIFVDNYTDTQSSIKNRKHFSGPSTYSKDLS